MSNSRNAQHPYPNNENENSISIAENEDWELLTSGSDSDQDPELLSLMYAEEWPEVKHRAASHPEEAQHVGHEKWTPLHIACMRQGRPPAEVVSSLLVAFPGATSLQDTRGLTPLHYAVTSGESETVRILLKHNIGATKTKNYHDCPYGNMTPLQVLGAWWRRMDMEFTPNKNIQCIKDMIGKDEHYTERWKNTCLLVKAAYHGTVDTIQSDFRMVHACAAMEECVSSTVLKLAVEMYPEQLSEADENGHLPLALAILAGKSFQDHVQILLEACPSALSRQCIDGRFYPQILSFLGQNGSISVLFGVLKEKPEIVGVHPTNEKKRKRDRI